MPRNQKTEVEQIITKAIEGDQVVRHFCEVVCLMLAALAVSSYSIAAIDLSPFLFALLTGLNIIVLTYAATRANRAICDVCEVMFAKGVATGIDLTIASAKVIASNKEGVAVIFDDSH